MAGKAKVAAVVIRVILVMSFSGSVSVSSSITISQRQCGTRSPGNAGRPVHVADVRLGVHRLRRHVERPSSMWWHMLVTMVSPKGSASISAPQ